MNELLESKSETTQNVMIVDQERLANLISKMLGKNYSSEVITHGMWAFNKLKQSTPDVIVVDVDIPGNGIRLAELVGISPKYQNIPIILMAANPASDIVIRARNAGANSFLAKPFGPIDLRQRIDTVLQVEELTDTNNESETDDGSQGFAERVKAIEDLPSFPTTHAEILKLAKSEGASSNDIAEKIQLDPGLLATVFKLVNSSYYGFGRKTDSLSLAVTLLGLEEIANLVMAAQVFEKLGNYEGGAGLDLQAFWKHSVGTAFIAREIDKQLQTKTDSVFLAGMLHDLGKIVLDRFFADYYALVVDAVKEKGLSIFDAEEEVLGLSHTHIGGQLAKEWQFADSFFDAICHHHAPQHAKRNQSLICVIHIADVLCRRLGYGSGGDDVVPDVCEFARAHLSLNDEGIAALAEVAEEQILNADSFLAALGN